MRFRKSSFWNVKSNQLKLTSCASAPWLPWPPSASGQGSSRTQPQPTWGGSDIPTRGDLRMVFENQTNLFFSPLLLLRASLCLFLCKKWDEITKQHQTLKMCENVFTWSITGVTRRWTLGAANFCFLPSWKCLNLIKSFLVHYTWRRTSGQKSSQS